MDHDLASQRIFSAQTACAGYKLFRDGGNRRVGNTKPDHTSVEPGTLPAVSPNHFARLQARGPQSCNEG
jgi:hypothetical protein